MQIRLTQIAVIDMYAHTQVGYTPSIHTAEDSFNGVWNLCIHIPNFCTIQSALHRGEGSAAMQPIDGNIGLYCRHVAVIKGVKILGSVPPCGAFWGCRGNGLQLTGANLIWTEWTVINGTIMKDRLVLGPPYPSALYMNASSGENCNQHFAHMPTW